MAFDPVSIALEVGGKLIDRFFPDQTKANEAKAKLLEMQMSGELAQLSGQIEINKIEAGSSSLFVAGWRPSVGWTCSAALAFQFIVAPLIQWGAVLYGKPVTLPALDTGSLLSLLMALLGVSGLRTVEKLNGVAR